MGQSVREFTPGLGRPVSLRAEHLPLQSSRTNLGSCKWFGKLMELQILVRRGKFAITIIIYHMLVNTDNYFSSLILYIQNLKTIRISKTVSILQPVE